MTLFLSYWIVAFLITSIDLFILFDKTNIHFQKVIKIQEIINTKPEFYVILYYVGIFIGFALSTLVLFPITIYYNIKNMF